MKKFIYEYNKNLKDDLGEKIDFDCKWNQLDLDVFNEEMSEVFEKDKA